MTVDEVVLASPWEQVVRDSTAEPTPSMSVRTSSGCRAWPVVPALTW
ncbi:hypothetical protein ABTX99_30660 [Streptomyces flaveolus]